MAATDTGKVEWASVYSKSSQKKDFKYIFRSSPAQEAG